jgi:hypothetical protein
MHMKIAVEILLIWTALDVVVGIPLWMLIKLRDRRERQPEMPTAKLSQIPPRALEERMPRRAPVDFDQRAFQRGHRRG